MIQKTLYAYISDRTRGAASLDSGEIETMIHRRLLSDDDRGVGEPLNENNPIFTRDYLIRSQLNVSARAYRTQMQLSLNPIQFAFSTPASMNSWKNQYKLVNAPLTAPTPSNLYIQTLRPVLFPANDNRFVLRIRHIFAVGEDTELSKPTTINISNLFKGKTISTVQEMNLLGTVDISQISHMKWITEDGLNLTPIKEPKRSPTDTIVTLSPMQTKTFLITFT